MQLTSIQKEQIKALMDEYLNSGLFVYDGSFIKENIFLTVDYLLK